MMKHYLLATFLSVMILPSFGQLGGSIYGGTSWTDYDDHDYDANFQSFGLELVLGLTNNIEISYNFIRSLQAEFAGLHPGSLIFNEIHIAFVINRKGWVGATLFGGFSHYNMFNKQVGSIKSGSLSFGASFNINVTDRISLFAPRFIYHKSSISVPINSLTLIDFGLTVRRELKRKK